MFSEQGTDFGADPEFVTIFVFVSVFVRAAAAVGPGRRPRTSSSAAEDRPALRTISGELGAEGNGGILWHGQSM